MENIPFGLSFTDTDIGYALRRKEATGTVVTIELSEEELLGLEGTIRTARDRIVPKFQEGLGSVKAIVALPVTHVRLLSDIFGVNVLLTFATPSQEEVTLSLPQHLAESVGEEIPPLLARMRAPGAASQ